MRREVAAAPFGAPRERFYEYLTTVQSTDPALKRYAAVLGSSGAGLIPTLSLEYLNLPDHENPWKEPVAAILDPKDIHLPANPLTGVPDKKPGAAADSFPLDLTESLFRIEREYCRAGAKYLTGSGTTAFGTMPGISLHTELLLLTKIGLSPEAGVGRGNIKFRKTLRLVQSGKDSGGVSRGSVWCSTPIQPWTYGTPRK